MVRRRDDDGARRIAKHRNAYPETGRLLLFFRQREPGSNSPGGHSVVGEEGTGPGVPYIAPECASASLLPFAMRSEDTHTPGPTAWCRRDSQWCQTWESPGYRGFLAPATGAGSSKKSLWNQKGQKWGGLSLHALARGPIPAPRRRCLRPVAWRHNCSDWSGLTLCRKRRVAVGPSETASPSPHKHHQLRWRRWMECGLMDTAARHRAATKKSPDENNSTLLSKPPRVRPQGASGDQTARPGTWCRPLHGTTWDQTKRPFRFTAPAEKQ